MPEDVFYTNNSIHNFGAIFDNATIAIVVTGDSGKIIAVNPFALKEFGYTAEELIGKKMEILVPPTSCKKQSTHQKKIIAKSLKHPGNDSFAVRKDGSGFPVEISLSNYTNNGKQYIISFINNISKRKKSEALIEKLHDELEATVVQRTKNLTEALQQLKISNHQLEKVQAFQKAILDGAGTMIIATDENGVITFFNHEASIKTGYDEEEVINQKTPILFHDKKELAKRKHELSNEPRGIFRDDFAALVEKAKNGIYEEEEFTYIRKDKTTFPVSLTITAVKDNNGKIIGFIGVAIDMTERRKAEDELIKLKKLFLQLLYNYPDGAISIIDKNYHFVYTGGELHKQLHSDIKLLIGKKMYPRFPEPLRKIIFVMLENVFQDKVLISDFELPYPIANRTYIMDAFPLMEEDGSVNNIGVIIKNISKLKKAEEGLIEALKKERNLGELKSRFVSMASHEFRTPLSTVLSSAYLIEKYASAEDQPKREKHLQRIISSVTMLTDILNEFLNIGKIEEGKLKAKFSEFNMEEIILATLEEIKNNLKKEQQINYRHKGNPHVFLDRSLLKHIVMNLISNASKFSSDTSVIDIKTSNQNEHIVLSVKDNGMGISKEDQQHLMERFFRGANAGNIQGTGLGLHIISKYAEMMNGNIQCKSQLEKGTEFVITFNAKKNHHEKNTFDRRQ